MSVKQPVTQVRLTNVAVVRYKYKGKRFEIACFPNKVLDWRKKIENEILSVLQSDTIFKNVSKAEIASTKDLIETFETSDRVSICKIILDKGQLQISERERKNDIASKTREIVTIIAEMCVHSETGLPIPIRTIESAMTNVVFSVSLSRPSKQQALELIRLLRVFLPIERTRMRVRVSIPFTARPALYECLWKGYLSDHPEMEETAPSSPTIRETTLPRGALVEEELCTASLELVIVLDPGLYRPLEVFLTRLCEKNGSDMTSCLEIIDVKIDETAIERIQSSSGYAPTFDATKLKKKKHAASSKKNSFDKDSDDEDTILQDLLAMAMDDDADADLDESRGSNTRGKSSGKRANVKQSHSHNHNNKSSNDEYNTPDTRDGTKKKTKSKKTISYTKEERSVEMARLASLALDGVSDSEPDVHAKKTRKPVLDNGDDIIISESETENEHDCENDVDVDFDSDENYDDYDPQFKALSLGTGVSSSTSIAYNTMSNLNQKPGQKSFQKPKSHTSFASRHGAEDDDEDDDGDILDILNNFSSSGVKVLREEDLEKEPTAILLRKEDVESISTYHRSGAPSSITVVRPLASSASSSSSLHHSNSTFTSSSVAFNTPIKPLRRNLQHQTTDELHHTERDHRIPSERTAALTFFANKYANRFVNEDTMMANNVDRTEKSVPGIGPIESILKPISSNKKSKSSEKRLGFEVSENGEDASKSVEFDLRDAKDNPGEYQSDQEKEQGLEHCHDEDDNADNDSGYESCDLENMMVGLMGQSSKMDVNPVSTLLGETNMTNEQEHEHEEGDDVDDSSGSTLKKKRVVRRVVSRVVTRKVRSTKVDDETP